MHTTSPTPPVLPTAVDRHGVQRLLADGAQLVDVLGAEEFRHSHLPGARHIPLAEVAARAPKEIDRSLSVVVYCYDSL